jgi:CRISPR-associated protein Cas1
MRRLLNTLYITTPNAYLSKDSLNLVVSVDQKEIFRIPIHNIESIVYFGYLGMSPGAIKLCTDNNVSVVFLSPSGAYIGKVQPKTKGNVLLRITQYHKSHDKDYSLNISRNIIAAKIQNYRNILQRFNRDNTANAAIEDAITALGRCKNKSLHAVDSEILRGIEGDAANTYFAILPCLILQQQADFPFKGRNRRPPRDAVNAMLSFAYTLLANDYTAALESVGLDPQVGFFHTIRPGRPSLSLDLMEELRAYLGDRFILSLINRKQITRTDFLQQTEDSIILTDSGRRTFLQAWQSRKKEEIIHPFLNEKIQIGLIPYVQAQLLARHLRGDLDEYPVFLIK